MATYFHGAPEIQPDGLQTLYLMNPGYVLSDAATPTNMFLLNPTMNSLNPMAIAHNPHPKQQHHLLGIPLQPMAPSQDPKQSVFLNSKYLKAAQQLLDEVVNVVKGIQACSTKGADCNSPTKRNWDAEDVGADLTTAERQELQMKKAKLVNMFDEVEQRYGQYSQQMQSVVSSFESMAGFGSARTYTALALQTISKQFRCLREAISCQIRATSKRLGDEHCPLGGTKSAGSRLRLVDHQVRQQRALQQLGTIQHKAWRPQRGLPERAVSVLRAWLFEHFLHPYPKDVDKHMLAKQTGLTRSQVSNWFINARVRLWKPMVEEMYSEEFKDKEQNDADEKDKEGDANEDSASKPSAHQGRSPTRTEQTDRLQTEQTIPPSVVENHEAIMQPCLKQLRSNQSMSVEMKPNTMSHRDLLMKFMAGVSGGDNGYHLIDAGPTNHEGGFGGYSIGDLERFNHEQFAPRFSPNGVSLTLGLQHCDNLSISGTQPSYFLRESIPLGRRIDSRTKSNDYCSFKNNPTISQPPNDYESNNIQNRKRFAAQLLQDFVA